MTESTMSFACQSDKRCEHPLKDCAAVRGEYWGDSREVFTFAAAVYNLVRIRNLTCQAT